MSAMHFPTAHPAVVGSILTAAGLRRLHARELAADAVEIRLDALLAENVAVEEIEAALRAKRHPVLLTPRLPAEGGLYRWRPNERVALARRLLPLVEAIDLELASARTMRGVAGEAQRLGRTVVWSAHALNGPATPAEFRRWIAGFAGEPRTILKIAGRIKSWRDLQQLAAVLVNHPGWPVAVMGLGPHAAQSRAVLAALGSRLVYGYLDTPAAPGQPSAAQVRRMLKR